MAKPHIVERKRQMAEERRHREDVALAAKNYAANMAEQEKEPKIALVADGAFCNLPWLRRWLSGLNTTEVTLPTRDLPGLRGGWVAFSDVEDACDLGRFGESLMGALEIFTIHSFSALGPWDRRMLGVGPHPEDPLDAGRKYEGLAALFQAAPAVPDNPACEVLSSWHHNAGSWAAGKPTLQACLPLEICYDHRRAAVLYARRLAGTMPPAGTAPTANDPESAGDLQEV